MWEIWIRKNKCCWEDLIHWMEINNLYWVNSCFDHPNTWYNKRYKTWYEIDGFVTTRKERIRLIRNARTDSEFSPSDHRPKALTIVSKRPKMETSNLESKEKGLIGKNLIVMK